MRVTVILALAVWVWAGSLAARADYISNGNFLEGLDGWHGDGQAAFLKPDGTEGVDGDPGAMPVIKIEASKGQVRAVSQEFEMRDAPPELSAHIEVYASKDFKRSKFSSDFSSEISDWRAGTTWYWSVDEVPNVDFWIKVAPGLLYRLANLQPGKWTRVDGHWHQGTDTGHTIWFMVPPGEGTVYLRNAKVGK